MEIEPTLEGAAELAVVVGQLIAAALATGAGVILETDALRAMGTDVTMGVWYTVVGALLLYAGWQFASAAWERSVGSGA